jgi:hypothetical protein
MQKLYVVFLGVAGLAMGQMCSTPQGSAVSDGPVSAQANFTVGSNFITVSLQNTLSDPTSAGQLLSGLAFTLSDGTTVGTLGSTSATIRKVTRNRTFTDFGPNNTAWALAENFNGGLQLCILCTDLGAAGPRHLLIGEPAATGTYASANGSIAGNKPHNPFTAGTATFFINVPTIAPGATVVSATFYFSTQEGVSVTGTCGNIAPA